MNETNQNWRESSQREQSQSCHYMAAETERRMCNSPDIRQVGFVQDLYQKLLKNLSTSRKRDNAIQSL